MSITNSKKSDKELLASIKQKKNIPIHIAIIMDGNGRWAKQKGLPRVAGHKQGVETVRKMVEACSEIGVKYLTLYTFSTENWKRPKDEITILMRLLLQSLKNEADELNKNNIRLKSIGDLSSLPAEVARELKEAEKKTENNDKMVLNLALSYSGRWDIIEAVKKISTKIKNNQINTEDINQEMFADYLSTVDMPEVDLLIRTSGEMRISNFLLWQIAYAEIFVADVFWPAFNKEYLYKAIQSYQKRERRFGMVSEQLEKKNEDVVNVN